MSPNSNIVQLNGEYGLYKTLISTDELVARMQEGNLVILDCRFDLIDAEKGARAYAESHIPGAIYANLNHDLSSPHVAGLTGRHPLPQVADVAQTFGAWGIGKGTQVVAYDDSGGSYAARAWWLLRWLGHDEAALLNGGWKTWQQEGRPVTATLPAPVATTFVPRVRGEMVAPVESVEAIVAGNEQAILLDARAADRFRGENETIDPVAGHIPGARNLPWLGNNDASGKLLSAEALAARYAPLVGDGENVVVYCGSGVTAAHHAFALEVAGRKNVRLYPGSWSDWITNPAHPIATGDS